MNESIYQEDYRKEKLQLWVDNLNLLYVAFTRPKSNLVVWCKDKAKNTVGELLEASIGKTSCQAMESVEDCTYQLGETCPSEAPKARKESTNKLDFKPERIAVKMESIETNIEFKQSNRSANFIDGEEDGSKKYIREGQVMHNLFSMLRTPEDVPSAIARLRMEGIIESDEHEAKIRKLTEWALKNPKVEEWFSGAWELYNECNILDRKGGTLKIHRPDRVMVKGDEAIVVDFKFGKHNTVYEDQVREYMNLLAEMGYGNVRGYVWYVFYNELEEIK
jgi:ATP-dependent exoDNAse (exonuclease V) beta subunit